MKELNPDHPTTKGVHDHWHKLCAIVMQKLGVREIVITAEDVEFLASSPGGANIVADTRGGGEVLTLRLVDDAEARRLAKEAGGLPV